MKLAVLAIMIAVSSSAEAQTPSSSQILVSASGTAKTPPDMVTVGFTLRGEGVTSDKASSKLRDSAKAMSAGIAGLLQKAGEYYSSALSIAQVRSKDCDANDRTMRNHRLYCIVTCHHRNLPRRRRRYPCRSDWSPGRHGRELEDLLAT
jgi:uncharacterized protein YggE